MTSATSLKEKWSALLPFLNEKQQRIAAAVEARALGHGGVSQVAEATGLSRTTLHRALEELADPAKRTALREERVRAPGGGRKQLVVQHPALVKQLKALVEATTRGDPMSPLLWTSKSTRHLAGALSTPTRSVSARVVANLLRELGYSLQANLKTLEEGGQHPDRDRQFRYLNAQVRQALQAGEPVISVDTKKKELIGQYANPGQEWRPHGCPEEVRVHDFIDPDEPKAIPYGIYDLAKNVGWVNVGCDHDTASFAMASIRRWWQALGVPAYPHTTRLLICADAGGSNGYRIRLWKLELQQFVDDTGLAVTVGHLPPGTSKWNKIEHRLFSHISLNWRGRPLVSHEVVVKLIGSTKTQTGLKVKAKLDKRKYPLKVKISDEEMASLNIEPHAFHGEWNYTIKPRTRRPNAR